MLANSQQQISLISRPKVAKLFSRDFSWRKIKKINKIQIQKTSKKKRMIAGRRNKGFGSRGPIRLSAYNMDMTPLTSSSSPASSPSHPGSHRGWGSKRGTHIDGCRWCPKFPRPRSAPCTFVGNCWMHPTVRV